MCESVYRVCLCVLCVMCVSLCIVCVCVFVINTIICYTYRGPVAIDMFSSLLISVTEIQLYNVN